jgi:hypothetical protein
MKNTVVGWLGGLGSIALLACLGSVPLRAAPSACAVTNPTSSNVYSSYQPGAIGTGCFYVDSTFSNMSTVTDTGTYNGAAVQPSTSNIFLNAIGSTTSVADFTATSSDWTDNGFGTPTTKFDYVAGTVDGSGTTYTNGTDDYTTPTTGKAWYESSITLSLGTIADSGAGNYAQVEVAFCLNNTALGTTGACAAGTGSAYGSITIKDLNGTYSFTCVGLSGASTSGCMTNDFAVSGDTVTFTLPTPDLAISLFDTVTLNQQAAGTVSLADFDTSFGQEEEAPEPSTFILLGSALAAIGLLRLRARRKSAAAAIQ